MKSDRRQLITECAVTIIAEQGPRALTHRAVDQALALPAGSTSYYFRTREALLEATALYIVDRSRSTHTELLDKHGDAAHVIAVYLDDLLGRRRNELIARYALLMETPANAELRELLVGSLFSHEKAQFMFHAAGTTDPDGAAADLLCLLEGLILDRCLGRQRDDVHTPGTEENIRRLHIPIDTFLRGLSNPDHQPYFLS